MPNLEKLSLLRAMKSGNVPIFPGNTLREKLTNGRAAAKVALEKHVPDFRIDVEQARDVTSHVDAWIQRNQADLIKAMKDPDTQLARHLCIAMGSAEEVQQWILANFAIAAAGLGPWMSGRVERLADDPNSGVTAEWVLEDYQSRAGIFAMIVKLDRDGELKRIFNPPTTGTTDPCGEPQMGAFGLTPLHVAIIIAAVVLASVVVYLVLDAKRVQRNNDLMERMCVEAQKAGDKATTLACVEALKDIQTQGSSAAVVAKEAAKVATVLGGGYLLIRYGLPWLAKELRKR